MKNSLFVFREALNRFLYLFIIFDMKEYETVDGISEEGHYNLFQTLIGILHIKNPCPFQETNNVIDW